jgi:DNA-binding phage protein
MAIKKAVKTLKPEKAVKAIKAVRVPAASRMPVSETNLRKAAARLLSQTLVSTEVQYIQHVLGATATQKDMDDKVIAVRKMPWASIVLPDA